MTTRRSLLRLLAGGLAWPLLQLPLQAATGSGGRLFVSARATDEGTYRVSGFTPDGRPLFDLPLPDRGHSFALHPDRRNAVHFARRPGSFAKVIRLDRGAATHDIAPPDDRRFYGHGTFSRDGRLLYATENDFEAGRGVIGVYDAADRFRRVGEMPSHGTGPHEMRLMPDARTLVVANGGIHTHPDMPRVKLNVPTMKPSLVYVDSRDGRLLREYRLPTELQRLSIRHVAIGRGGTVALAMQYVGPAGDLVPLVATQRGDTPIRLLAAPDDVVRDMNQYTGATVFDRSGRVFAVSSPRGDLFTFWDAASGELLSTSSVADGSGIAPADAPGQFLASSGRGGVVAVDARTGAQRRIQSEFLATAYWDNHMIVAGSHRR